MSRKLVRGDLQKALAAAAAGSASGKFAYNKFFAIGLFRLLELTGAKEPAALEKLVKSVGVKQESVMRDLVLYKVNGVPVVFMPLRAFFCAVATGPFLTNRQKCSPQLIPGIHHKHAPL